MQNDRADPDEIATEYAGKLKVTKVNIDDNQATPAKFGIRGIPTLMIFKMAMLKQPRLATLQVTTYCIIDSNL